MGKNYFKGDVKMNTPLVSIITPSYNRANFIEFNIKSMLYQTYKNFEHIIVDGGSTDGTIGILEKYKNKYNVRWISEKDDGIYDAVNKGIKMAKGEIIAYLNTDDIYLPWTIEVIVKEFIENKVCEMVYGDALRIDLQHNRMKFIILPKFNYKIFSCVRGLGIVQPSVFLKKNVFQENGYFDTAFRLSGDSEFWCRLASKNVKMKKIAEILSTEISHSESFSFKRIDYYTNEVDLLREKYCFTQNNFFLYFLKILTKIKSLSLSRWLSIQFSFFFVLNKVFKLKTKKWSNTINEIASINLLQLLKEMMPYNFTFKKYNMVITFKNFDLNNMLNYITKDIEQK